jgi:ABC-2 type transport system permease protein
LCVGLAVLLGAQLADRWDEMSAARRATNNPAQLSFLPLLLGQIALVVFGVLLASAEYTSGTIRASLSAVTGRGVFLAAKALVAAGVAAAVGVVSAFGAFFATQWAAGDVGVSLASPGALGGVLGACLYLTMMCVFATGLAMVLRSSALSLGILLPLLFMNSQGLASLPAIRPVTQYLPDQAGAVLMRVGAGKLFIGSTDFGRVGALLVLSAWVGTALVGGYVSLRRRDA